MKTYVLGLALMASIGTSSSQAATPSPTPTPTQILEFATQTCANTVAAFRDRFSRIFIATTNCPATPAKVALQPGILWDTNAVPYGNPGDTCILQHAAYLKDKAAEARTYAASLTNTMDVTNTLNTIAKPLEGMADKLIHANNRFSALKQSLGWTASDFTDNANLAKTFSNTLSTNEDVVTGAREALLQPLSGILRTEQILNNELRNVSNPLQEQIGYNYLRKIGLLPQTDTDLSVLDKCLGTSNITSSSLLQKSKDLYQNSSSLLAEPKPFLNAGQNCSQTTTLVSACPVDFTKPDCSSISSILSNAAKALWNKGMAHSKKIYEEVSAGPDSAKMLGAHAVVPFFAAAATWGYIEWRASRKRAALEAAIVAAEIAKNEAVKSYTTAALGVDHAVREPAYNTQENAKKAEAAAKNALTQHDNQARSWKARFFKLSKVLASGAIAFMASEAYGLPYMMMPTA